MKFEDIMICYVVWAALCYLILAKKPRDARGLDDEFGQVVAGFLMVALLPLWLIICCVDFYRYRRRLRWLKKWWWLFALSAAVDVALGRNPKYKI